MTTMTTYPLTGVGPLCQCGCGERLPAGSMRKYKRGHRARVNRAITEQINREQFDGYNDIDPLARFDPKHERMDAWDIPQVDVNEDGSFTIQDAAETTPDDPDGDIWSDQPNREVPKGVIKDIEGKLAFMLATSGNAVRIIDPTCGGAVLNNTAQIAKNLTPILCQSPGVVAWFQKSSNFMLYINLMISCWPVLEAIYAHHFSAHDEKMPNGFANNGQMNIDPNMYRVN